MHEDPFSDLTAQRPNSLGRLLAGYVVMIAVAVALFLLIREFGEASSTEAHRRLAPTIAQESLPQLHTFRHVLIALVAILATARATGWCFSFLGQPRVIGEVVAGLLLGPSFLGRIWPDAMTFILPSGVAPYLGVLAQLGVVLYMFLVGLELNADLLKSRAHATLVISHASIVAPFLLGAALALWLHGRLAPQGVSFTSFALFMGVAMSITALPVLARILTDRGIEKSELGAMALSCAAADDVTAWCLLAFVIGISQAQLAGAVTTLVLAAAFLAFMLVVVRPAFVRRLGASIDERLSPTVTSWILIALLVSAVITDAIGIHAIFGAFLLGAVVPHDGAVARVFRQKLEDVVSVLLLPAFFAYTGMRTQIGLLGGVEQWMFCLAIIGVATLGKLGGTMLAARCTGLDWRTSAALGALMNTRGLMEIIVLDIGLDLGVISPTLFAMMVLMAIVTTMMTAPILQRVWPQ